MIDWLQTRLGISPELQLRLLATLATMVGLWLVHRIALSLVYRRVRDPRSRYRWRKTLTYLVYVAGIVIVGPMWFAWVESFTTIVGFLSAGLAIALKDPVSNLAGWAFILWRRPFEVGDRVQIGPHAGDVIDLGLFQFTINEIGPWVQPDQASGRIIHVPNGKIFTDPVANYNKGFKYIWNEVPVLVTFESDWRKAKQILTKIAVKHAEHLTAEAEHDLLEASQQYLINYRKLTPIVYTKVVDSGVQLTIRYLIEPRKRRGTEHAIWEEILTEFAKCPDIDLAYHTVRGFKNTGAARRCRRCTPESSRTRRGRPLLPRPSPSNASGSIPRAPYRTAPLRSRLRAFAVPRRRTGWYPACDACRTPTRGTTMHWRTSGRSDRAGRRGGSPAGWRRRAGRCRGSPGRDRRPRATRARPSRRG